MSSWKLKPLARAIAPSMVLFGLTACGGGGGGDSTDTPRATNQAPIAKISVIESPQSMGNAIVLNGEGSSDADSDTITFLWTLADAPPGSGASIVNAEEKVASLRGDVPGDYVVQLIVNDSKEDSAEVTATITLTNSAPIANAGNDMLVELNGSAALNGSASADVDGQELSFQWVLAEAPEGSSAYLDSSAEVMSTLLGIDLPGQYRVELTVNDGFTNSQVDSVILSTENAAPIANAGIDVGGRAVGDSVMLDGTQSSDPDGGTLTYSWVFTDNIPDGSNATLQDADTSMPSFTIDVAGSYELLLTISDGELSSSDVVTVNVGNSAPIADAGDNVVATLGEKIQLSAEASTDIDGDNLSFRWAILDSPEGSMAVLENPSLINSEFTPDLNGHYVIQLVVSDGELEANDNVEIDISSVQNLPPIADAGEAQAFNSPGEVIILDGSGSSDPEGGGLIYSWSFSEIPQDSEAMLAGADSVNPSFTADVAGNYVVQLMVNDGELNSAAPSTVVISIGNNLAPIAHAGEAQTSVLLGQDVYLDGSESSDPNQDPIRYQWSVTSAPADADFRFDNNQVDNPVFTVNTAGDYLLQLKVNDGLMDSMDTVFIRVSDGDPDGDGLLSSLELANGLNPVVDDSDSDGVLDGDEDQDGDSLSNQWEQSLGYDMGADDSDGNGILDGDEDFDGDGKTNYEEITAGTDPAVQDQDVENPDNKGFTIFKEIDSRQDGYVDSQSTVTLVLMHRGLTTSERKMQVKSLEGSQGDKTLLVFLTPLDSYGTSLLTHQIKNNDDNQWLYLPALKRVKEVGPTKKSGPFMGSEFSFEDLAGQQIEEFNYKYLNDEVVDGIDSFVVESYPLSENSGYSKIVTWVDKNRYVKVKSEFYDRKKLLLKTLFLRDYQLYDGRFLRPGEMLMQNHQTGRSSALRLNSIEFNTGLIESDLEIESFGENISPVADAGPSEIDAVLGQPLALNGSSITNSGNTVTYEWTVQSAPQNSQYGFDDSQLAKPVFTFDSVGQYKLLFTVFDGQVSDMDEIVIRVSDSDIDGDGLMSSNEIKNNLDPLLQDSDGDGVLDGAEDQDGDGLTNQWEQNLNYDLGSDDSDNDGIKDGAEDFDGDGKTNLEEFFSGTDPRIPDGGTISELGLTKYTESCSACHETGAAGSPKAGDVEVWNTLMEKGIDELLKNTKEGLNAHPPGGLCFDCSDEVFKEIIYYMSGTY